MGNLCSIFHMRFKQLIKVIPCARKAQLVDYILLGWQTSTYTLKNSTHKWFMKPYTQIVEDTGIPKSTLERYIKELHTAGFIARRQALYSRTNEQGEFTVKKGAYLAITDKLLALLESPHPSLVSPAADTTAISKQPHDAYPQPPKLEKNKETTCTKSVINEGIDSLKTRGLYISNLYTSFLKNNIISKKTTTAVDKATFLRLKPQFVTIEKTLYTHIKEEIPNEVKKLVLGTFFNLTFTHQHQFSSPKQVVVEYLFALLNREFYMPKVKCFKHRNNILAKLVHTKRWCTPKGFYEHFYLGQDFKDKQVLREEQWQRQKNNATNPNHVLIDRPTDARLIQLEAQMLEKSTLLEELMHSLSQQSCAEVIVTIRKQMHTVKQALEQLWQQQALIERELVAHPQSSMSHCA